MLVNNGKYVMNEGVDPLFLAEKYGTPLYVYDFDKIAGQFHRLKAAFDVPNLQLDYACKALTNINLLRFVKSLGGALDTVSIEEAQLGLSAGFEPQEIMFTPNGVAWEEMVAAVGMGLRINIDSLPMLERFGRTFPDVPVCIRINPHIMAGGNTKISVGHIDSKFGISYQQLPSIKAIVENTGMCINGLHMHTGSDIADPEAFLQGADLLLQLAMGFPDLDFVDLGGGFKVTYKPGDQGLDLERLGAMLSARFRDFCQAYGKNLTLVFEPGKFLVSEAGYLLATTSLIKKTPAATFAFLNTGLNHLIRPMFYHAYHHIVNVSNPQGDPHLYQVVGYICETDTLGHNREIPEVREGDVLCLLNAGAYGFMMASNYNSRPRPAEVMLFEGKDYLIRERETMEDLRRHQIDQHLFD